MPFANIVHFLYSYTYFMSANSTEKKSDLHTWTLYSDVRVQNI